MAAKAILTTVQKAKQTVLRKRYANAKQWVHQARGLRSFASAGITSAVFAFMELLDNYKFAIFMH